MVTMTTRRIARGTISPAVATPAINVKSRYGTYSGRRTFGPDTGIFTHFGRNLLKAVKILTYIFLCFFIFVGVIATRGSLQILVTQLYNEIRQGNIRNDRTVTEDAISWLLILIICIPDLLNGTMCALSFLFGDRTLPGTKCFQFILIQLKEVLHVVGLMGLVFRVMPFVGPVETSAILAAIPGIPTIVQAIFIRNVHRSKWTIRLIITVVTALVMMASVVVMCVFNAGRGSNSTEDTELMIWIIASCVLLSLRWVETYITRNKEGTENKYNTALGSSGNDGDSFNFLVSSVLRLLVALVLISQYFCRGIRGIETTFHLFRNIDHSGNNGAVAMPPSNCTPSNTTVCPTPYPYTVWLPWEILPSFLVHFFSSALVYHLAITACKLCMQRVCFAIPLVIASPVYVIATFVSLEAGLDWSQSMFDGNRPQASNSIYMALVVFFAAWIAQVWSCRQAWHEPTERLCFREKLFVIPHYCSPVIDLSLLHSRRRMRPVNMTHGQKAASTSKIYICATMWHENRVEMKQILSSFYRLDLDQFSRKISKEELKAKDHDYYEFEGHVPFDDAMTTKGNKRVPNDFVEQLIEVIDEAGSAVHGRNITLGPPERVITPYGGRLVWTLPGGNKLIVHLKDKDKIRHKKRWSQIMYMYYLIGYEMLEQNRPLFGKESNFDDFDKSIFEMLPETVRISAENTYFLALDGDVDFEPEAIRLLVDRMKKDPKVGATCGRIKPGGSGPVVWYQRFEYAIGHWLQKSAEHVFGCVLCSPGCFSMFRAKALMDDNVMRTYALLPTEPRHYLQYDQGEDRWLCTLMLQQGYRIEYCAAAEALTFAPEDFKEFFNQRRRWLPSTMANIIDLLGSSSRTTKNNSNISYLYIIYQTVLLASSILGPSTVLLAMESSLRTVFPVATWVSYVIIYVPTIIFIFICLKFSKNTQLNAAMVLSALYALLMMAVIVGIIVSIAGDGWYTPTAIFLYILIASFILAGLFHPHEFKDLLFGVVYFICIPAGYLFLIIFAICNLNDVSWGTRETQKAVLENPNRSRKPKIKEAEDEFSEAAQDVLASIVKQVKAEKVGGGNNSCKDAFLSIFRWANNLVVLKSLSTMQTIFKNDPDMSDETTPAGHPLRQGFSIYRKTLKVKQSSHAIDDESWAKKSPQRVSDKEDSFWKDLIQTYLYPLDHDEKQKREVSEMLEDFRNRISFGFFFVNGLWVVIMTAMTQVKESVSVTVYLRDMYTFEFEPLGFVFLMIFAVLLLMQMVGMIAHRHETLLHVLAATDLRSDSDGMLAARKKIQEMSSKGDESGEVDLEFSTGGIDVESVENPEDLEEIYEDFQLVTEKVERKPRIKQRLDLDRNYRKTVRNMKRRQTQRKQTNSRVNWKGRGTNGDVDA
ncbi:chitin synthase chs-2-like [Pecten maximus]|uniref:chitin synthase chs-2-like n=1 Tax=Pecten maximus TaxID=6579 RepID=UPI0014585676|nr:chitin synthase chs-2-like [Pecten maximus]